MPSNRQLHVGERIDRDADIADFAGRHLVIGIVAALRRQVERDEDLLGADLDHLAEARLQVGRFAESRIGGDHERSVLYIARAVAAGERVFAREAEIAQVVEADAVEMRGRVERIDRDADVGGEFPAFGAVPAGGSECLLEPARAFTRDVLRCLRGHRFGGAGRLEDVHAMLTPP